MIITRRVDGLGYCEACYKRVLLQARCFYCSNVRVIHARDLEHHVVCYPCYAERFAAREPCLFCEEPSVPTARGPEGHCICTRCWQREMRPAEPCVTCGVDRVVAKRTEDGDAQCWPCRFASKAPGLCPYCEKVRPLAAPTAGAIARWCCDAPTVVASATPATPARDHRPRDRRLDRLARCALRTLRQALEKALAFAEDHARGVEIGRPRRPVPNTLHVLDGRPVLEHIRELREEVADA